MARRNDHTREELKNLAIATGKKLIELEGITKFSARKLAKELGYSVGTLYNVFENSNDIIMHINMLTMDDMEKFVINRFENNLVGGDAIKNLARSYIVFAQENYNIWCALFELNISQDYIFPEWYSHKINLLTSIVERPLLPLLKDPKKVQNMANILWAGVHGICQMGFKGQLDMKESDLIDVLVGALIDHYTKNRSKI